MLYLVFRDLILISFFLIFQQLIFIRKSTMYRTQGFLIFIDFYLIKWKSEEEGNFRIIRAGLELFFFWTQLNSWLRLPSWRRRRRRQAGINFFIKWVDISTHFGLQSILKSFREKKLQLNLCCNSVEFDI